MHTQMHALLPASATAATEAPDHVGATLQELAVLLHQLRSGGHKALIFTQMTKMLDILEAFLNLHGFTYLRLDGTTKPEQRQVCPSLRPCTRMPRNASM